MTDIKLVNQNAVELGLDTISRISVSEASDIPGFTMSFVCAAPTEDLASTRPRLEHLHLDYSWKTRSLLLREDDTPLSDLYDHPFSKDLTLPLQTLLDDVSSRFVKNSLVRRYPFVFGNLARQFKNEAAYFRPMIMSIKGVVKRSLDPVFRFQCGQLLKVLRNRYNSFADLDLTTEYHDRTMSQRRLSTEAAFYLAMQRVFKAGMKWTTFKGTHVFINDIEEHELLEMGLQETGLAPDQVTSLPPEDLLLDEDEDSSELGRHRDISLFEILDFPRLDSASLAHPAPSSADKTFFDTDSDVEDDSLVDTDKPILTQKSGSGDISIGLDESDEDESQESAPLRTVQSIAASLGGNVLTRPLSQPVIADVLGVNDPSLVKPTVGIYVADISPPPKAEYAHRLDLCTSLDALTGHDVQQTGSCDTRNSQEKGYGHHMSHPASWTQVAPWTDPIVAGCFTSGASLPVNSEYFVQPSKTSEVLLNTDLDTDSESSGSFSLLDGPHTGLDEPRRAVPNAISLAIHSSPNLLDHALHQNDFLDVLSEVLYSDEELEMNNRYDRDLPSRINYIDCIIDEDMITDLPIVQRIEEPVPGDEDFDLVAEGPGPGNNLNDVPSPPSNASEIGIIWVDEGEMVGWAVDQDEMGFVELIA